MNKNFLKHYGVLGMHWGRRKAKTTTITKQDHPDSEDHKTKELLSRKKLRQLSNAEIRTLTERLNLEKQHRELTKKEMSKGKKYVLDLMKSIGDDLVKNIIKTKVTPKILSKIIK